MLDILVVLFQILAGLIVFVTFWGFVPLDYWWVRMVDFPRIQFICVGIVAGLGMVLFGAPFDTWQWLLLAALTSALAFQSYMVLPYTRLWRQEVRQTSDLITDDQVTLLVSNVLTPNNNTAALIRLIKDKNPDIVLTLESDKKWQNALDVLESEYRYSVKVPLDNLYGMHLYSKLRLIDPEVKYLLIDDIPSIHTQLKLRNGKVVWLYCLHPMPPSPTEADKSTTRDAELLLVGRHIKDQNKGVILAGDLNDVAWSKTTRMFQRISGLLDPRIGRFFINTFHVDYPFLRWALDHLFHSPCFTLVNIERLPSIGSDHFPVMTTLQYEPQALAQQVNNAPTASATDEEASEDKIKEGIAEGKHLSRQHQADADSEERDHTP